MGLALENPEQYMGGSGGGGLTVLPSAYTALQSTQLADGSSTYTVPNVHPDIIGKIAYDPTRKFHMEIAGLESTFKIANPNSLQTFVKAGAGGSVNVGFDLAKGLRILTNNFWSDGGGRYIFGLAPDLIVRANGTISPVHAGSTVSGFEYTRGNTLLYGLYGGVYVGRDTSVDTTGKLIGYGYSGFG